MSRSIPKELAQVFVQDEQGAEVRLGEVWRERPIILAFMRHFGWMFCREHVVQLHHEIDRIHAVGAELVVISSGQPHFVQGFRELTRFDGPIYCDPELASYQAAKLHRSGWRMMNPKMAAYAVRAMARGAFQGSTQGDFLQQGGVLVILPPDRLVYEHLSDAPGDNAPAKAVVVALEHALGKSAA